MQRSRCLSMIVLVVISAMSDAALARDKLESTIKKEKLSRRDRSEIETEVQTRAKKLAEAGDNSSRRKDARDALISTIRIKKASQAGIIAYAQACGDELANLVTNSKFEIALDAAIVLVELANNQTAKALARALLSEHPAVRYLAARGIQQLHKDLAASQEDSVMVLKALGRAGASESDAIVLRMVYNAINFHADVQNYQFADDCARALNEVFATRTERLKNGSHDEWKDEMGYSAALDCYAKATRAQQRELIKHMVEFLKNHLDRYFDQETAQSYLRTLKSHVKEVESAIYRMMEASSIQPPSNRLSNLLRRNPTAKMESEAKAALAELTTLLERSGFLNPSPG